MNKLFRFLRRRGRAVAAVEFAIAAPTMLIFLGGVVDFGLAYYDQGRVIAGVGAGAEYALLNNQAVIANASTSQSTTIPNIVQSASGLTGMQVTVTGLSPTVCYCVSSGSPPTLTAQSSCTATCSNGAPAGYYVFITGSYTYQSMLPGYSKLVNPTITETATVQIQ
jgi:Flp pilus assembly protein TadG